MIANKVYTRDEMREEHIITSDYHFIDKEGEYFAKLIMRAEASKNMMRLFFQLSDGRKIITPVFWWQSYVKLVIVAEDGTFIDPEDTESLKNYVVTGQSVAPNTELKLVFDKDSDGEEYDLVESQNIEEVELNVKKLTSETQSNSKVTKKATTNTTSEKTKDLVDGMRPEFKAAMDSYETFINGYVDFMKKYSDNPDDLSLLAEYSTYMDKYDDMVENFDEWEDEDMNDDETAYYIDVQARVSKKLLEVTE